MEIDVFMIAGQSNAVGFCPVPQPSPKVTTGKVLQWKNSVIVDANDPVGGAGNNSAWPAFGQTYYEAVGRAICFVPCAANGTQMVGGTGASTWDTTGTLVSSSNTAVSAAMSYLTTFGHTPIFQGILWCQGESDASNIQNGIITVDQYKSALRTLIANYRTTYGATTPFYIFKTGMNKDVAWDAGYAAVRDAQEEIAAADPYTAIVFRGAKRFRGLHYTEEGQYNFMGRTAALAIADESALSTPSQNSGVWVPRLVAATTPGTPAYALQQGTWDRIGREMRASFTIQLSGWTGSPAGNVSIADFPFAAANVTNDGPPFTILAPGIASLPAGIYSISGIMNPGQKTASIYGNGVSVPPITAAHLGSTPLLFGQAIYYL